MIKRKIIWDKPAVIYFSEAIRYIRKDSPQNADKAKKEIREKIAEAALRPEINPPDKYNRNKQLNFRAFELHRFRVVYLVKEDTIIITRIRHTSQEPLNY